MSFDEFKLNEAWAKMDKSLNGKPLNESKEINEEGEAAPAMTGATSTGDIAPFKNTVGKKKNPRTAEACEDDAEEKVNEGLGDPAMDIAGGAPATPVAADADPALPAPEMAPEAPLAAPVGLDDSASISDLIQRLKNRFPAGDVMISVKLAPGATFSDAEIEAALDAVEGVPGMDDSIEDEVEDEVEDDENEDSEITSDDEDDNNSEFGSEEDEDDEDEDEDDEDEGEEEEIEENDILVPLDNFKDEKYQGNDGIMEAEDKDKKEEDKGEVEPCCFTMTTDQWEQFLSNDPFKAM